MISNYKTRRRNSNPNQCLQVLTHSLPSPRDFITLSPNREPSEGKIGKERKKDNGRTLSFLGATLLIVTLLIKKKTGLKKTVQTVEVSKTLLGKII